MPFWKRTHARMLAFFAFSASITFAYACISAGLAAPYLTGDVGAVWARLWAVQWLQMLVFVPFLACWGLTMGPDFVPIPFLLMLLYNCIGGWNLGPSQPGFDFFMYAPFYHTASVMRNIFFGSMPNKVGMHVGILFLWAIVDILAFYAVSWWTEQKRLKAAAAAAAAKQQPAIELPAAAATAAAPAPAAEAAAVEQKAAGEATAAAPAPPAAAAV